MSGSVNTSANFTESERAGDIAQAASLLRSIAKSVEPAFPGAADLLRGQANQLSQVYRGAQVDALREAADRIEAEAHAISGPGHLRAWWVIARLRDRAVRLGGRP